MEGSLRIAMIQLKIGNLYYSLGLVGESFQVCL